MADSVLGKIPPQKYGRAKKSRLELCDNIFWTPPQIIDRALSLNDFYFLSLLDSFSDLFVYRIFLGSTFYCEHCILRRDTDKTNQLDFIKDLFCHSQEDYGSSYFYTSVCVSVCLSVCEHAFTAYILDTIDRILNKLGGNV